MLLIVVGLLLLPLHISKSTKHFVAGALVGVGAGGALGELMSTAKQFPSLSRFSTN